MAKKSIVEIVEEKLPTFASDMKSITSSDELNKALIVYLRQKEELLLTKARDEELNRLKEKKAKLSKPYNQTISALKKMSECIYKFGHKFQEDLKDEFEKNLIAYARQLADVKAEKGDNETLNAVDEAVKEINEDYNPAIKMLEMKSEYISYILKERFKADGPKVEI